MPEEVEVEVEVEVEEEALFRLFWFLGFFRVNGEVAKQGLPLLQFWGCCRR